MRSTLHRTQVRFGLILFVIGVANFAFALQNYLVGHRDLAWSLVGMISGAGMAVFGGSFIIGTKRPRTANSEHRTTDQAMSKPKHVGIPIGGGVLTFEPSVSTATFWIVEAVHWFVSFGKASEAVLGFPCTSLYGMPIAPPSSIEKDHTGTGSGVGGPRK